MAVATMSNIQPELVLGQGWNYDSKLYWCLLNHGYYQDGAAEGVEMTYYNGSCTTVQEFCQTFDLTWKEGETCIGKEEEDIPFNTLYRRSV